MTTDALPSLAHRVGIGAVHNAACDGRALCRRWRSARSLELSEPIQSVRPHVGKVLLPGCAEGSGKRRPGLNFPTLRVAWCPWARQNHSGRRISWASAGVGIDR